MRNQILASIFFLSLSCYSVSAQKNVRDSLKSFTIEVVQKAIAKGKIKKIAVWDFTDLNKEVSVFGSYIAEQFSVYAENIDTVELMDRQNLKSLLNEHKLKSEGFIDKNTIMELGRFREVDAVVVGSVIMADKDFQVVVKIIETSLGRTIAADEQFFQIDKRMAAILGIEISENANQLSQENNPNRGYNRPLSSNEQYNNPSTVNKECDKLNTGDYCFFNGSDEKITVRIYGKQGSVNNIDPMDLTDFTLNPKESKCIYGYSVGSYKYLAYLGHTLADQDSGNFLIEKCKSKTFTIKIKKNVD